MRIMQDINNATMHLKTHQSYPAAKADLVEQCNKLSDFSEEDKKEFAEKLPEGTYNSAEEVITALGWQQMPDSQTAGANMSA